ncbi:MAG TPA: hypothetical protein PK559_11465 [Ignavibacteriaceae bacterium]|nr:hypothetical protein [Ignavibacteriaceae bacterium]
MREKSLKLAARFISTLFIPPLSLLFATIFFLVKSDDANNVFHTIIISLLFGVIIPIVYFLIMLKKKKIANQDASIKEERTIPYLFGILFMILGLSTLVYFNASKMIQLLWIVQIVNTLFLILINKYWKISAHMIGFSSPVAWLVFNFSNLLLIPFVILGIIIGWSRFHLKCHTIPQIIAGFLFGFGLTYLQLLMLVRVI